MTASSRAVAEHAAFESFANCYLREVDGGVWAQRPVAPGGAAQGVELALESQGDRLRLDVESVSACGPHRLGRPFFRKGGESVWRATAPFDALTALLREAYAQLGGAGDGARGAELELLGRALDSYQATAAYLERRTMNAAEDQGFLAGEQSLVFGHWLHPTPKSLQGMASWQRAAYAPEMRGSFRLTAFAVDEALVRHDSAGPVSALEIARGVLGGDLDLRPGEIAVPMHPLQAEALLLDPRVEALIAAGRLRRLGPAGPHFAATSSVRTVYAADAAYMLKFSLPVRITNSVRTNRRHELEAGVAMARLFARVDWPARNPRFRIVHDPAHMTLDLGDGRESGFEVIFRDNPFRLGAEKGVATVAALSAAPAPGETSRLETLVRRLAERDRLPLARAAEAWFEAYLDCAIEPPIALYDELGIALEAHQQNAVLDVSDLTPAVCHYRDSQGFYLSSSYRARLDGPCPEAAHIAGLYYDDDAIRERFGYYLIVNQAFSIVSRMGHDGLVDEQVLLALLRERLEKLAARLTGAGRAFARDLLNRPTLSAKANLVTRLYDIDELSAAEGAAVYAAIPNPLRDRFANRGQDHALAV